MGIKLLLAFAGLICTQTIFAGVTITGTRIIFPSDKQSVTVQLNNQETVPALVQSWLDDGNPNTIPEADLIPFILTPPLVQIEAKKGQMIRIIAKNTEELPKDRESLYWFNILDIPPELAGSSEQNKLQVSIRTRIKLFYRPIKLEMNQDKAFKQITFQYLSATKTIKVNNPTPYYINFYDLDLKSEKNNSFVYATPLMVAPYASESFIPKINFNPTKVEFNLINDYGANQFYSSNIEN